MAVFNSVRVLASSLRPASQVFLKCSVLSRPAPILLRSIVSSSRILNERKFTADHEWVLSTGDNQATIGITDYAQDKLGEIVFIELPEVGSTHAKDDPFGTVESVKAASDVISPVSGEVTEVNSIVEEGPEIVNKDPLGEGWLIKMSMSDPSEFDSLMSEKEYEKYLQECD